MSPGLGGRKGSLWMPNQQGGQWGGRWARPATCNWYHKVGYSPQPSCCESSLRGIVILRYRGGWRAAVSRGKGVRFVRVL
jgi:hypothetical protein